MRLPPSPHAWPGSCCPLPSLLPLSQGSWKTSQVSDSHLPFLLSREGPHPLLWNLAPSFPQSPALLGQGGRDALWRRRGRPGSWIQGRSSSSASLISQRCRPRSCSLASCDLRGEPGQPSPQGEDRGAETNREKAQIPSVASASQTSPSLSPLTDAVRRSAAAPPPRTLQSSCGGRCVAQALGLQKGKGGGGWQIKT